MEQLKQMLDAALQPVVQRLDTMDARLHTMDVRLDRMEKQLTVMEKRQMVTEALQANGRAGLHDKLMKVPLRDGTEPDIFPATLGALAVGGSELAAGTGTAANWNRDLSLRLILMYDPNYETEAEALPEDAQRVERSSRRRRLRLAKQIGVSPPQLQMALVAAAELM